METHKVFVREDGSTVLKCPYCGHARTVSVKHVKDNKKTIKVRCLCKKSYSVALEYRRLFRKNTSLKGKYKNLTLNDESGLMTVEDVSMGGIGFEAVGNCRIKVEHELKVTFTLDDTHSSVIKKDVVVRIVRGSFVGCEFLHAHEYDKALGFYLLP